LGWRCKILEMATSRPDLPFSWRQRRRHGETTKGGVSPLSPVPGDPDDLNPFDFPNYDNVMLMAGVVDRALPSLIFGLPTLLLCVALRDVPAQELDADALNGDCADMLLGGIGERRVIFPVGEQDLDEGFLQGGERSG
jgi:hypothetical protein